jgi:hypothetical protein
MTHYLIKMTNPDGVYWWQGGNRWSDCAADGQPCTEAEADAAATVIRARLLASIWDNQTEQARVKIIRFTTTGVQD